MPRRRGASLCIKKSAVWIARHYWANARKGTAAAYVLRLVFWLGAARLGLAISGRKAASSPIAGRNAHT